MLATQTHSYNTRPVGSVDYNKLALFCVFLCVAIIIHHFHEAWRDEYIAYNIAARSHSLAEIYKKLAYEGHPILWYAELYFLIPLIHSPLVLDVAATINLVIALWLMIFRSPFTMLEKIILLCGYYFLYEYSAISRSYTLVPPLLFGICYLLRNRGAMLPRNFYLSWGILCVLLANVNIYSTLLVFPLSLVCATGAAKTITRIALMAFALVVIACVVASLMPPPSEMHPLLDVLVNPASSFLMALAPFARGQALLTIPLHHIWMDYYDSAQEAAIIILAGIVLFYLQLYVLEPSKRCFFAFIIGAASVVAMMATVYDATTRHVGHIWLLWVALLWIDYDMLLAQPSVRKNIFYGFILLHAVAGIWMAEVEIADPFSDAQAILKIIQKSAGNNYILASLPIGMGGAFTAHTIQDKPELMYGKFEDTAILDEKHMDQGHLLGIKNPILPAGEPELLAQQKMHFEQTQKIVQVEINSQLPVLLNEANKRCVPAFIITQRPFDATHSSVPIIQIFQTTNNTLSDERWYAYKLTSAAQHCIKKYN